ncbi:MAG TPA: alpha/beta hydrolase, partial [Longimicrobium sp.]
VRQALGYEQLDLNGGSYGTRAALTYMREYPARVRSAVLTGVVPFGFLQPAGYARTTDAALAGILAECRADAACSAAFPNVEQEMRTVAARIQAAPAEAEILDPVSRRRVRLRLPYGTFAETIRKLMYAPGPARTIPFLVHRAHEGDYRPLLRAALADRRNNAQTGWGLFLALTCSEDVPFIDMAEAARDNGRTLLGDYRVQQQAQACAGWPRRNVPAAYHQPLRSEIPTFLVSGAFDPVTPPANGEQVASTLSNAVHVVVPGGAHGVGGMRGAACVDSLAQAFVRQASGAGLDVQSCVGRIRPPPFVIDIPEAVAVDQAVIDRLAGAYASTTPPLAVRVEPLDGHIRIHGEDIDEIGTPLSATRFRLGNGAGVEAEFSADGSTMTVRTPGNTFVLTRQP